MPEFAKANLKEPIHLAFSYDEEIGCTGCMSMIEHVRDMAVKPRACIVGEPTNMKVVNSHKGLHTLITKVRGEEAHASTDRGVNAIYFASRMIGFLDDLRRELKERTPRGGRLRAALYNPGSRNHIRRRGPQYHPGPLPVRMGSTGPFPAPIRRKFPAGWRSSSGRNFCRKWGRVKTGRAGIATNFTSRVPALLPESGSSAETLVLALAKSNEMAKVSYGTEAGHFQETGGIPTVICGPGSILQAHRPDEYIEPGELARL